MFRSDKLSPTILTTEKGDLKALLYTWHTTFLHLFSSSGLSPWKYGANSSEITRIRACASGCLCSCQRVSKTILNFVSSSDTSKRSILPHCEPLRSSGLLHGANSTLNHCFHYQTPHLLPNTSVSTIVPHLPLIPHVQPVLTIRVHELLFESHVELNNSRHLRRP